MQLNDQKDFEIDKKTTFTEDITPQKRRLPAWTGFGDKTLWDILQFVCTAAVPIVLTVWSMQQAQIATQIARDQEQQNQQRNDDNQRAKIMSDYLDAMTKYLLEDPSKIPDVKKANMIARARTLNTLRQLDGERKGQLLKFLYEASLVRQCQFDRNTGYVNNCNPSILRLNGARLDDVVFDSPIPMPGVDLTQASLPNAMLQEIDLTDAQLQRANLDGADLTKAQLHRAQMQGVDLQNAKLPDAELLKADLTNALLSNANLSGSHLVDANLHGATLKNVNLDSADLRKADLRSADLTGASLKGVILNGAMYSQKTTQFPAEFNPEGKGMIRQE